MVAATPVNLVRVNIQNTGTGAFVLGSALAGFRGVEALISGATYSYSVQQGGNYEFGRGVYSASGPTLTRGVIGSSYGNDPINLSPNAVLVFPALAEDLQVPGPPGPQGETGATGPQGIPGTNGANGAGINMPVLNGAGAYTLALTDANTYRRWTDGSPQTITIPAQASVAWPAGTIIAIEQAGAGTVTIAGASGVTVNSRGGATGTAGQFAVAQIKRVAADVWTLLGDVA